MLVAATRKLAVEPPPRAVNSSEETSSVYGVLNATAPSVTGEPTVAGAFAPVTVLSVHCPGAA